MGILDKARAHLVSRVAERIKSAADDAKALSELVLELERCRADLLRGIEALRREEEYYKSWGASSKEGSPLTSLRADIAAGEVELKRAHAALAQAQSAFAAAAAPPKKNRARAGAASARKAAAGKPRAGAKGRKK
jgi:hypothetical protein